MKGAPKKKATGVSRKRKPAAARPATAKTVRSKSARDKLKTYREMRDFARTSEPSGKGAKSASSALSFVVQKHAASHLHYDFRLELEGVLLSWSVPKGPTLRAGERRLAVRTEDHPLAYASFEGTIPKGQYGGGSVIVWDRGTWEPLEDPARGMKKGRLSFELSGEKLRGRFHLVRMARPEKRENWLLFKSDDEVSRSASREPELVEARPESVLTGRTVEEVAGEKPAAKKSKTRTATKRKTSVPARPAENGRSEVLALVKKLPVPFTFSNLEKVLYPEQGLRKGDLLAYLAAVADWMLPHVAGRPLTLVRCPDGRTKHCFFQKHPKEGLPEVVRRVPIREERKMADYLYVEDVQGLLALAQNGVLELHTWVCHVDRLDQPDQLVFDLDPDETLPFEVTRDAALEVQRRLLSLDLTSFAKTTGGKGLHVVVPLTRRHDFQAHKAFARSFVEAMAQKAPKLFVTDAKKSLRKGRIFLDYLRNGRGATAVAPYSPRAREGAPVATPLAWSELEKAESMPLYTVATVLDRLSKLRRDPWQDYASTRQALTVSAQKHVGRRGAVHAR